MKMIRVLSVVAAMATAQAASAEILSLSPTYQPTVMIGVTFAFGGGTSGIGFSARVLSSNEPNKPAIAGGVTFYPWAQNHLGLDLGIGMSSDNFAGTFGYDFIQNAPVFSLGGIKAATTPSLIKELP